VLPEDVDPETGEMTFVFTDIMNSTDAAIANPLMMQVLVLFRRADAAQPTPVQRQAGVSPFRVPDGRAMLCACRWCNSRTIRSCARCSRRTPGKQAPPTLEYSEYPSGESPGGVL
jgi:hypothetical protein